MDITKKNEMIDSSIKYLSTENKLKDSYGEKWVMLTGTDKKNIIKKYLDDHESHSIDSENSF